MRISSAFPSDYLKAADLQGRQVSVKIDRVEIKEIGGEPKPILFFVGKDKGMVLNKTNAGNIAQAYGDDTDDWQDADIILFEAMVDFQGKTVPAIRIRVPPRKAGATRRPDESSPHYNPNPDNRGTSTAAQIDDDIPF